MDVLGFLQGKKAKPADDNEIQPGELKDAGVEIKPGDPRLKGGINRDNLDSSERQKLDNLRKNKSS